MKDPGKKVISYGNNQHEVPLVEVLWDGSWCPGTLHEWRQTDDGRWEGWVRFNAGVGDNRIEIFDQDQIRLVHDEVSRNSDE